MQELLDAATAKRADVSGRGFAQPNRQPWHRVDSPWSAHMGPRAVALWRAGQDTLQIARSLGIDEATVYNLLPEWRTAFGNLPGKNWQSK